MKILLFFIFLLVCRNNLSSQACMIGDLTFSSDSDMKSFSALYRNCDTLVGSIHIKGQNITNLDSLYAIKNFNGDILIDSCANLTSILGLKNLTNVHGSLTIKVCPLLKKLDGLQNLKRIVTLLVRINDSMDDVSALNKLNAVTGYFYINQCPQLRSLPSFDSLKRIGSMSISKCGITTIDGFNALDTVIAGPNILEYGLVFSLSELISCKGFNKLKNVGKPNPYSGHLLFEGGMYWQEFDAFHNLEIILADLHIRNFTGESIAAFQKLKSIEDYFSVFSCSNLKDLDNFSNLVEIMGSLDIHKCDSLKSIAGLKYITLKNYKISVKPDIRIMSNKNLYQCHIESICYHLANPSKLGALSITNNKEGCNSADEILALCSVGVDPIIEDLNIKLSPNPFLTAITVECQEKEVVNIYDSNGRKVLSREITQVEHSMDTSSLPNGIYLVKYMDEKGNSLIRKMIKME